MSLDASESRRAVLPGSIAARRRRLAIQDTECYVYMDYSQPPNHRGPSRIARFSVTYDTWRLYPLGVSFLHTPVGY